MKITILSMLNGGFDPYWRDVELGVRNAEKNFSVDLEFLVPGPEAREERDITAWQLRMIDDIARRKDSLAVAVAMLNYEKAMEGIRRLTGAGIPVITFDTDAPQSNRAFYVGTNNFTAGSTCAYNLVKKVGFKGDIVVDAPSMQVQSCIERIRGFKSVLERYKDIRIAREAGGEENIVKMRAQAEETLRAVPDLKGIYCISGTSAKVNAEVLTAKGLAGKVKIVCVDADKDIIRFIREGAIDSTIAQRPYTMGFRVVDYLYQIGTLGLDAVMKSIPKNHIVDTGIHNVTKENIDTYRESLVRLGIPVDF